MNKITYRSLIYVLLLISTSCSQVDYLNKYNCKILETKEFKTIKKTIYIQIPEQLTELQLEEIAAQMKTENTSFQKLFIFYLLPDMQIGKGAWATTHYNPILNINIIGVTKETENKIKDTEITQAEIVGKWFDNRPYTERSIIIFKINQNYKVKTTYKDGSSNEEDLIIKNINGKTRFDYLNKSGEYYIIEDDGTLSQYDNEGKISNASKK